MNFQDKKQDILAAGAKQRGQYSPEPGSWPTKAYNYYVSKEGYVPPQENFCHFWRVVVIWVPLYWFFFNVVEPIVDSRAAAKFAKTFATPFALVHRGYTSLGTESQRKKFWSRAGFAVAGLFGLAAVAAMGVVAFSDPLSFFVGMAIFVGVIGIIAAGFYLGDLLTRKSRAEAEERRRAYVYGEISYEECFGPRREAKKPGRVSRFFRHLGDFFLLVGNVIRVKKWKICPLVEVPKA
jgi:cation transport ATPase